MRPEIKVKIVVANHGCLPHQCTPESAGFDIYAFEDVTLHVGEIFKVRTGFAIEFPPGYEGQIRSRSGLARQGVCVVNSPGTIDSDYRGEVCVLMRSERVTHQVKAGDRIAQLIINELPKVTFEVAEQLEMDTVRGLGGFGSTGIGREK